jgi:hypothetical protein
LMGKRASWPRMAADMGAGGVNRYWVMVGVSLKSK